MAYGRTGNPRGMSIFHSVGFIGKQITKRKLALVNLKDHPWGAYFLSP
jgi:hypothetical protein